MRRLLATLVLTAAALPAVWLRSPPPPPPNIDSRVQFDDLMPAIRAGGAPLSLGVFDLVGAWHLRGQNSGLGNYSALGRLRDGRLVALSDKNGRIEFDPPGTRSPERVTVSQLFSGNSRTERHEADCEALAIDPATGDVWTAFEDAGSLWVFSRDFSERRRVPAPALKEWTGNAGPEAMTRLADGRFVAFIEARESLWHETHPALVWPAAPEAGTQPLRFSLQMPFGYRPTDAATLPDGRLLVLGRRLTLAGFRSVIVLADPAAIRPGETLRTREIARIGDRLIRDNYEGMTAVAGADGGVTVWLISDHNLSVWFQRTLLLELRLRPGRL